MANMQPSTIRVDLKNDETTRAHHIKSHRRVFRADGRVNVLDSIDQMVNSKQREIKGIEFR